MRPKQSTSKKAILFQNLSGPLKEKVVDFVVQLYGEGISRQQIRQKIEAEFFTKEVERGGYIHIDFIRRALAQRGIPLPKLSPGSGQPKNRTTASA